MYFELKNIGAVKQAKIELGKLTVLCGKNNTGKSYIISSIYGFLSKLCEKPFSQFLRLASSYFKPLFKSIDKEKLFASFEEKGFISIDLKEAAKDLDNVITLLTQLYAERLGDIFSRNKFIEAEFRIRLEEMIVDDYSKTFECASNQYEAIKKANTSLLEIRLKQQIQNRWLIDFIIDDILFEFFLRQNFPKPFILSAERASIQLFQKELDKRSCLVTFMKNHHLALEEYGVHFSLPIEKNVDFTTNSNLIKSNSFLKEEKPELTTYIEEMLGVEYQIINGQKVVIDIHNELSYHHASNSVRALFDLHLWLKHQVNQGDILFIEEPELGLHPENQVKMARLLVILINSGINVFITTHSDYILSEINNLLLLSSHFPEKKALMKELGYTQDDILYEDDLRAYLTHTDGTVSRLESDKYGIGNHIDGTMVQINKVSNKLMFAIDNAEKSANILYKAKALCSKKQHKAKALYSKILYKAKALYSKQS